jgi:hypothetical protein
MGGHEGPHAPPAPEAADRYEVGGAGAVAVPRFMDFLRFRQPSIFWSLVLHLIFCQVSLSYGTCILLLILSGVAIISRSIHHTV